MSQRLLIVYFICVDKVQTLSERFGLCWCVECVMLFLDFIKLRLIKSAFIITFLLLYLSGTLSRREACSGDGSVGWTGAVLRQPGPRASSDRGPPRRPWTNGGWVLSRRKPVGKVDGSHPRPVQISSWRSEILYFAFSRRTSPSVYYQAVAGKISNMWSKWLRKTRTATKINSDRGFKC